MGKLQGSSLDRRFFHRLGASLLDRTICATAGIAGCDVTLGTRAHLDPEAVIHSRYIINWGSNTSVTNMHLWAIMHQARKGGAKIVTIDPYRCKTAARSDWWMPIRPGTDAALALGMMHVIWRDGLQDQDYLDRYCLGAEQLRERVLAEYPLEKVSVITGIPASDIERLAREYATIPPSLIRVNYGMQRHGGGGMAVRTITCLPAIIGAWRHAGGGALLSTSRLYPFNSDRLERPDLIPPGTRTINMVHLAEALNGELSPPPIQALYVYNSNPAAVCPD
jgi:anaerobic selenocysteine-containing dehydrogenase